MLATKNRGIKRSKAILASTLVILFGCVVALYGMIQALPVLEFVIPAYGADGTVIDYTVRGNNYYAVVEFDDLWGQTTRITDALGMNPPQYRLQEKVPVLYLEKHPEQGRINSAMNLWLLPLFVSGIGVLGVIIGTSLLGLAYWSRKYKTVAVRSNGSNS